MPRTTFSVAIPTHDRRETALLAAQSALRQTRPPVRVILLCDGCTDGTADAARAIGDPRLVAIDLPKASGYGYEHRNVALERAGSDAILWLADDDLLLPDHLERLGERWDDGDVDLVTAPAALVRPDDTLRWIGEDWGAPWSRAMLSRRNSNVMASVSVGVDLARRAGGWDGSVERGGDWDLWKRALDAGARAATTGVVTVLHFRAAGREQSWADRVRQNTAWLERLDDERELTALRRRLDRLRVERDRAVLDLLADREQQLARIHGTRWWRARARLARLVRGGG